MNTFVQLQKAEPSITDAATGFQYTLQSSVSELDIPRPVKRAEQCTIVASTDLGTMHLARQMQLPQLSKARRGRQTISSMPTEIWEGTVQSVDSSNRVMSVLLEPMLQQHLSRHTAEISLDYVVEQDLPLVSPGAVFYLTIFVEKKRTSIQNAEEIRFRRMPAWSKAHIKKIEAEAAALLDCIEP